MLRVIGCVVGAIVIILLYEMIGIFTAYKKQPELSEETKQSLHPEDIYTDATVEERACIIEENGDALLQRVRLIEQAKEEIRRTVLAYTERTPDGALCMPLVHQRPLLLMGPPGVGKTAVFYQLAQELGINLVSYTMTHHTRQSALGLPLIREKTFGGKPYSATEYTMSEILASVYERMEQTGVRTGILFLDEINCVSETLMPAMLQLLQSKQFGTHRLPEGWVIAAAGNPPAYNESARSFDTVTMDRVRLLEISENYPVWRDYAHAKGLHPAASIRILEGKSATKLTATPCRLARPVRPIRWT